MNLVIQIERLVLDGLNVAPDQQADLQVAMEAELTRLLMSGGLHSALLSGGALPRLQGGDVQLPTDARPAQFGQQIARAVHHGLGQ